jgi:hypothetical protein
VLEAELLITLTGLRRKRRPRSNRVPGHRLSERTVTRRYRHAIDICHCIAEEAKAVGQLSSLMKARRAKLHRRCGRWAALRPAVGLLRNLRLKGKIPTKFYPTPAARKNPASGPRSCRQTPGGKKIGHVQSASGKTAVPPPATLTVIFFPVGVQVEAAQSARYPVQTVLGCALLDRAVGGPNTRSMALRPSIAFKRALPRAAPAVALRVGVRRNMFVSFPPRKANALARFCFLSALARYSDIPRIPDRREGSIVPLAAAD